MKFTLKCEHYDYDIYTGQERGVDNVVMSEFNAVGLDDILDKFEMFLRGNGFYIDGVLDVVKVDDFDYNDPLDHYDPSEESEQLSLCPVCKIDTNMMKNHTCFDKNCPKVN